MNLETLLGLGGIVGFLIACAFAALAIATIILPFVVIFILTKVSQINRTLAAMEWMMRNGNN